MEKIKSIIRWVQFLGWAGLWVWAALTDDPSPWRTMFAIACFMNAFNKAFDVER